MTGRTVTCAMFDVAACTGTAADQSFAHHGIWYEINLCGFHAKVLDFVLEPFKQAAREIPDYQP